MLADPKYMKTIYGHGSAFYKTEVSLQPLFYQPFQRIEWIFCIEFYRAFTFLPGDTATMAIMNNREHAKKRSLYSRCMTKTSILTQQRHVQVCARPWAWPRGIDLLTGVSLIRQDRCEALVLGLAARADRNNGSLDLVKEMSLFAHDAVMVVTM